MMSNPLKHGGQLKTSKPYVAYKPVDNNKSHIIATIFNFLKDNKNFWEN
jgi:hypothetical protein